MGVKGLWAVLTPYSEKKALHEICGETVAIDLSGWVCDSQNVTDYHVQPKLYLRTIYLLLADINPIFVLEGDAPELKRDVMAARNAMQFRGAAPKSDNVSNKRPDVSRKRFKNVLKECEALLSCMGVQCIKGRGEAEATCAQLNAQGLVDAVVSQDSDCFAYGARCVYRNFSVSSAAGGGSLQGSVDCYDADKMFQSNGFGRNKMVALALLCGCDYVLGACGSSINTAVSFLHTVPESDIIPRLLSWVTDTTEYEERARWASATGYCDRCGHVGRTHSRNGCPVCVTHKGCNDNGHKSKVSEVKRELSLRSRALTCGMPFPEPKVMQEFLNTSPENIDIDRLKNPTPSLIKFVKLMSTKLDWSERYCVEKFLPLLTKWHFQDYVPCRTIKPIEIKKKRNPRGVPSYVVLWGDTDGQYEALIPDDQFEEDEDPLLPWTSTERQDLMRQYYSEVVESYEDSIKKPPKVKKARAKKKDKDDNEKPKRKYNKKVKKLIDTDIINLSDAMKSLNVSTKVPELNSSKTNVSVSVNKLKRKLKTNTKKGQKTIDSFITTKKRKSIKKAMHSLRRSLDNMSLITKPNEFECHENINEKENRNETKNLLNLSNLSTDNIQESDLSDLIDNIVTRSPITKTATVDNNLVKLIFNTKYSTPKKPIRKSMLKEIHNNCSTPKDSPIRRSSITRNPNNFNIVIHSDINTSYFFDKFTDERDAFEISMEYKHKSAIMCLDCDQTIDYSLPDVCL
ncbi:flap endonuclease GEN isoform X2 [Achroia grisella]|uniref:flap endonuclease GEN isoform X2 n=1 Tax=Achroia grisella TaxID=688607 RepID=UPI0027D28B2F|nr:flap endonuclease GEN isoform X2 [Achroia grisella]